MTYAYGNPRREKGTIRMDVEDGVLGQQMQRLVACRVDQGHMPLDIVRALVQKASSPQCFSDPKTQNRLWEDILATACAVIQKYRHDIYKEKCLMDLTMRKWIETPCMAAFWLFWKRQSEIHTRKRKLVNPMQSGICPHSAAGR